MIEKALPREIFGNIFMRDVPGIVLLYDKSFPENEMEPISTDLCSPGMSIYR
jgi:hypothetical protein